MSTIWLRVGKWLLNRRWWFVTLASLCVFTFEFFEYRPFEQGVNSYFLFEVLFYGIVLPASTGLALSWLAASRSELAWLAYYQDLIPNLSLQLHNAHTYDELAAVFLPFIRVVIPLVGVTVYKHEQNGQNYKTVLNWSSKGDNPLPHSNFACATDTCPFLTVIPKDDVMIPLQHCRDPNITASSWNSHYFCLPFVFSDVLVAGARLYLPPDVTLSPEKLRLLNEVAPIIASTFHRIELERSIKQSAEAINAEQQRIARDVHDALGHSLAYLRLRLDQITMELNRTKPKALQQDVAALRDVAKEAYDQMRGILIMLSPDQDSDLDNVLMGYTDKISRQVNFKINFHRHGLPRTLPALTQRNILYIFQESLTNSEKHARAQQVDVELNWHETSLEVKVTDDGIGYDPAQLVQNGHFGLKNMRERARECNAGLSISSEPGHGTQLVVSVPYKDGA